jgi:hypothetical protein
MCDEEEILDLALSVLENRADGDRSQQFERCARDYALEIIAPLSSCRKALFLAKRGWLDVGLRLDQEIPHDVAVLSRHGPLSEPQKRLVEQVIEQLAAPLFFVGDLDPTDLTTYATLISGNREGSKLSKARYLGVGDEWIKLCESDSPKIPLSVCCIPLDAGERSALDRLTGLAIDWRKVVGKRGMKLLASGMKLELEGASNPAIYTPEFRQKLVSLLFR